MTKADRLRDLAETAKELADDLDGGYHRSQNPRLIDVLSNLLPSIRVNTYRGANGTWWTSYSLPKKFVPKDTYNWTLNNGDPESYYWADASGKTKEESLRKAINRIVEEFVADSPGFYDGDR